MSVQKKRYQVFISSTFEDLREERRAVQDVVISTGDFPVQMESFPAADENQFPFIRTLIDECDYYVLIIAGRYGTATDDGLSYTHAEFRYAVSKHVPVLVMLHGDRGIIPAAKTEASSEGKRRLEEFIGEAEKGRIRKTWVTMDGLKLAVREALDHAKATKPRSGWVRGDAVTSLETLAELNEVRKENEKFREALGNLAVEIPLPPLPSADDPSKISLLPASQKSSLRVDLAEVYGGAPITGTWISLFPYFFTHLKWSAWDYEGEVGYIIDVEGSCVAIGSAIASDLIPRLHWDASRISETDLERLKSYYIEAGLLASHGDDPFSETAKRIARRHQIAGRKLTLSIDERELKTPPAAPSFSRDMDEDIPF